MYTMCFKSYKKVICRIATINNNNKIHKRKRSYIFGWFLCPRWRLHTAWHGGYDDVILGCSRTDSPQKRLLVAAAACVMYCQVIISFIIPRVHSCIGIISLSLRLQSCLTWTVLFNDFSVYTRSKEVSIILSGSVTFYSSIFSIVFSLSRQESRSVCLPYRQEEFTPVECQ